MRQKLKIFVSLAYAAIFLLFALTGALQIHASELPQKEPAIHHDIGLEQSAALKRQVILPCGGNFLPDGQS